MKLEAMIILPVCQNESSIETALLKMPRRDRARAEKMDYIFLLNETLIQRLTKRYWLVKGFTVKLGEAIKRIPIKEDEEKGDKEI